MAEYKIKLNAFEGPLDLLIHLLEKNKIDIYDIPIVEVTEQYMAYLDQFKEFEMEIATEFLVMAATLLQIKSRMLLPKPPPVQETADDGADPRQELVERLLEYRRYKEVSETLEEMAQKQAKVFFRQAEELDDVCLPPAGLDIRELIRAFRLAMEASVQRSASIAREKFSVPEKMTVILALLTRGRNVFFEELFRGVASRPEIIVTFMAMLELMRLGKIEVIQNGAFAPIQMRLSKSVPSGESA